MRQYLIILLFSMALSSCAQPAAKMEPVCDHTFCKSFIEARDSQIVFYKREYEQIERKNDTLRTKLFLSNYKVEKVRYYLNIVRRKPEQKKYIVGWIGRAIE